jgi:hypothetical protein
MILRPLTLAVPLALLFLATARADESWAGLKVLNTKPKVELSERVGDKEIRFELTGSWLPVLKDQGGRLRVRDYRGKEGWAEKANFVRVPDAPAFFSEVVRKNPQDAWAWSMRATAWGLNGDSDKAIADHTEAIRIDPKRASDYYGRAGA